MSNKNFNISGFKEAVFVVTDLERSKQFYLETVGWQLIADTHELTGLQQFCYLPENTVIKSCLVAEPESDYGAVRLVEIENLSEHENIEQVHIRANSQIWDVGGIFDVNCRIKNSHQLADKLNKQGWFGVNLPVEMHFGPFKVYEWLAKSHDGIVHALIERLEPPIENDNQKSLFSALINSSIIVNDHQQEKNFFQQVLGFEPLIEQSGSFDKPCSNVFAMPHELVAQTPNELTLLSPDGSRFGTVELASFPELTGNDFSARNKPYNLGITTLRFPVNGLSAFKQYLTEKQVEYTELASVALPPYGEISMVALQTPAGTRLEFFESVNPAK